MLNRSVFLLNLVCWPAFSPTEHSFPQITASKLTIINSSPSNSYLGITLPDNDEHLEKEMRYFIHDEEWKRGLIEEEYFHGYSKLFDPKSPMSVMINLIARMNVVLRTLSDLNVQNIGFADLGLDGSFHVLNLYKYSAEEIIGHVFHVNRCSNSYFSIFLMSGFANSPAEAQLMNMNEEALVTGGQKANIIEALKDLEKILITSVSVSSSAPDYDEDKAAEERKIISEYILRTTDVLAKMAKSPTWTEDESLFTSSNNQYSLAVTTSQFIDMLNDELESYSTDI